MLRGEDSSGLASIEMSSGQYVVHKLPIAGNFFAEDTLARTMILDACSADVLTKFLLLKISLASIFRMSKSMRI